MARGGARPRVVAAASQRGKDGQQTKSSGKKAQKEDEDAGFEDWAEGTSRSKRLMRYIRKIFGLPGPNKNVKVHRRSRIASIQMEAPFFGARLSQFLHIGTVRADAFVSEDFATNYVNEAAPESEEETESASATMDEGVDEEPEVVSTARSRSLRCIGVPREKNDEQRSLFRKSLRRIIRIRELDDEGIDEVINFLFLVDINPGERFRVAGRPAEENDSGVYIVEKGCILEYNNTQRSPGDPATEHAGRGAVVRTSESGKVLVNTLVTRGATSVWTLDAVRFQIAQHNARYRYRSRTIDLLRSNSWFATLDTATLENVADKMGFVGFATGDFIYQSGKALNSMFLLIEGQAITKRKGRVIARHLSGDCLGSDAIHIAKPDVSVPEAATHVLAVSDALCSELKMSQYRKLVPQPPPPSVPPMPPEEDCSAFHRRRRSNSATSSDEEDERFEFTALDSVALEPGLEWDTSHIRNLEDEFHSPFDPHKESWQRLDSLQSPERQRFPNVDGLANAELESETDSFEQRIEEIPVTFVPRRSSSSSPSPPPPRFSRTAIGPDGALLNTLSSPLPTRASRRASAVFGIGPSAGADPWPESGAGDADSLCASALPLPPPPASPPPPMMMAVPPPPPRDSFWHPGGPGGFGESPAPPLAPPPRLSSY
eukprot:TRINITY_DN19368_c0_g2_i1.p1 TRINITY_DN19368_c0_g2~~TRINITY_DN19368_c0_g2_i1.p1  ORF type:complete len:658 (+),score=145.09 TRINITY_DN19368_c0_g2_i1:172-2145(+)